MAKKKWIQDVTKNMKKGALHRDLGAAPGAPIPPKKIEQAASGNSKTAQRARLALTLAKMRAKRQAKKK